MKKLASLVFILVLSLCCFNLKAQKRAADPKVERELQEFKIKFLAQEMELNIEQQKKFAEVYNRMMAEKKKVYTDASKIRHAVKKDKNVTEADYAKATESMAQAKIKDGEIEKKYEAEFKTFLSAKQIYQMKQAEDKFRSRLKQLKNKKK